MDARQLGEVDLVQYRFVAEEIGLVVAGLGDHSLEQLQHDLDVPPPEFKLSMSIENCALLTVENCTHPGGDPLRVSQIYPNSSRAAPCVGQREVCQRSTHAPIRTGKVPPNRSRLETDGARRGDSPTSGQESSCEPAPDSLFSKTMTPKSDAT